MPISITCSCGSAFEARDQDAGRQTTCPDCGAKLRIPETSLSAPGPSEPGFRCADCGGRFPAAEVIQDDEDIVCRGCREQVFVPEETGIDIHATFFPLMWLLFFMTPKVEIDGREEVLHWNRTEFFPLGPGRHNVRVWVAHVFGPAGVRTQSVRVSPNRVRSLRYQYVAWWAPAGLTIR
jgi:DNA-directed RNA polymerase subunit RPC12/RpoP